MSRLATQEFYFGRHIPTAEIMTEIESVDDHILERLSKKALSDALSQVTIAVVGPETITSYGTSSFGELLANSARCHHRRETLT
jgi:hypothetical protein